MLNENTQKNAKQFVCKKCSFKCSKNSDYNRHLLTRKHKMLNGAHEKEQKYLFSCHCGKEFKHVQSLNRHKKQCDIDIIIPKQPNVIDTNVVLQLLKENSEFKSLLLEQSNQMMEQSNQMMEIQKKNSNLQQQLITAVEDGKLGNTTNNITTNNNQRFNLNLFLNEQCKDAMNIEDFIDSLQLELEDLTETKRLGFVQGISRIFTNKLQELDIYSRPLHCTDLKRETVYIKDDNQWEKDNQNKDKLKSIVNRVANKNYQQLPKWKEHHPNYMTMDSQECNDFIELTCKALGGKTNNEDNKFKQRIMKNVLKEVTLEKIT